MKLFFKNLLCHFFFCYIYIYIYIYIIYYIYIYITETLLYVCKFHLLSLKHAGINRKSLFFFKTSYWFHAFRKLYQSGPSERTSSETVQHNKNPIISLTSITYITKRNSKLNWRLSRVVWNKKFGGGASSSGS